MLISLIFLIFPVFSLAFYAPIDQVKFTNPCSEEVAGREGNFHIESASDSPLQDDSNEDLQRVSEFPVVQEEQVGSTKEPSTPEKPKLEINSEAGKRYARIKLLETPKMPTIWVAQGSNVDIAMEENMMMMSQKIHQAVGDNHIPPINGKQMDPNRRLSAINGLSNEVEEDNKNGGTEKAPDSNKDQFVIYDQPSVTIKKEEKETEKDPQSLPSEEKARVEPAVQDALQDTSAPILSEQKKVQPEHVSNDPFDLKTIEDIFSNSTAGQDDRLPQQPPNPFEAASEPDQDDDTVINPEAHVTTTSPSVQPIQMINEEPSDQPKPTEGIPAIQDIDPTPFLPISVIVATVTPNPELPTETVDQMPSEFNAPVEVIISQAPLAETTVIPSHLDDEFPYQDLLTEENILPKLEAELSFAEKKNLSTGEAWKNNVISSLPNKESDEVMEFLLGRIYMWLTMLKLEKEREPQYQGTFWSQIMRTFKCIGIRKCDIYTVATEISPVPVKEGPTIPRKRHTSCQCQRADDIHRIVYMIEQIHRIRIAQGAHSSRTK